MIVLGIETSCDETAAAVLAGGRRVLPSVVASQDDVHAPYGGVVPELASRRHLEVLLPVIRRALETAGVGLAAVGRPGGAAPPCAASRCPKGRASWSASSSAARRPRPSPMRGARALALAAEQPT